jgi:hypothetical protein
MSTAITWLFPPSPPQWKKKQEVELHCHVLDSKTY